MWCTQPQLNQRMWLCESHWRSSQRLITFGTPFFCFLENRKFNTMFVITWCKLYHMLKLTLTLLACYDWGYNWSPMGHTWPWHQKMSHNKHEHDENVPILNYFGLLRTPKKIICTLSLRGRTQSLYSLLNTVPCPFRYPLACLILTSRLSDLERTHYWMGQRWRKNRSFGLKNKLSAADTIIGNLLKRRAGLRRPTASGLNCVRRTSPWHASHSHHVHLIWSGLSFGSETTKK